MDRDSAMHSTISSAASARVRQKNIPPAMSLFLGVRPRSSSSNLSLSLQQIRMLSAHNQPKAWQLHTRRIHRVPMGHGIYGIPWNFKGCIPDLKIQGIFIFSLSKSWNIRDILFVVLNLFPFILKYYICFIIFTLNQQSLK